MIHPLPRFRFAGLPALAVALAIAINPVCAATQGVQPDPVAVSRAMVTQLSARQFSEVASHFDDRMKAALPEAKLGTVWDTLVDQTGPFRRISHAEVTEKDGLRVVIVGCEFENVTLNAKLVFSSDGRVAGLFFTPADTP